MASNTSDIQIDVDESQQEMNVTTNPNILPTSTTVSSESSKHSRSGSGTNKKPPPIPRKSEKVLKWQPPPVKDPETRKPLLKNSGPTKEEVKDGALQESNGAEAKKKLQESSHTEEEVKDRVLQELDGPETKKSLLKDSSHIEEVKDNALQELDGSDTKKAILQDSSSIKEEAKDSLSQESDDPGTQTTILQGSSPIKEDNVLHEPGGSETKKTLQDSNPNTEEVIDNVLQESDDPDTKTTLLQDSSSIKDNVLQESDGPETKNTLQDSNQNAEASEGNLISNQSEIKDAYSSYTELANNPEIDSQRRKQEDSYQINNEKAISFEEINKQLAKAGILDNDTGNETQQPATNETVSYNETQQPAANETVSYNETQQPGPNEVFCLYEVQKHLKEKGIVDDSQSTSAPSSGMHAKHIIEAGNNIPHPINNPATMPAGVDTYTYQSIETNKNISPYASNPIA
ncbi:27408_t:CDS:2, partial [Racocetra persica]